MWTDIARVLFFGVFTHFPVFADAGTFSNEILRLYFLYLPVCILLGEFPTFTNV